MNREKSLEKAFKVIVVLTLVLVTMVCIWSFVPGTYNDDSIFYTIHCVLFSLLMLVGCLLIFLMCFGDFVLDHVQAEKIAFNVRDLKVYLESGLKNTEFKEIISISSGDTRNIKVYVNKPINGRLIYLYYLEEKNPTKETINEVSDMVDKKIVEYYNDNPPLEKKDVILLLSVDKFSPLLKYYTNRNLIQDSLNKEGHIIAVYVKEEGMLYVTKQVRGYGISFYKRLRKDLFDILEIQNVEKDSK